MRVCHFSATAVEGHYFRDLSRELTRVGVSITCGSLSAQASPRWLATLPGVGYFSLGVNSRARYPRAIARLAALLCAHRIDILQTHLFDGGLVGIAAARLARVPLVIVMRHHLDQHQLLGRPLHIRIDRMMAHLADHVVVPSHAVRQHMIVHELIRPECIEVIHHGLDVDAFASGLREGADRVRQEFNLGNAFVIGSVGRLVDGKGFTTLLAAVRLLKQEVHKLRVLIVGDHPEPANQALLAREIAYLGLEDQVIFAGHRSDVAACMQAMDVLAHPSQSEAFGQVLIEAMAVGTPIVASDVGGIPEVVKDGTTGILVPATDTEALAKAIATLYRDDGLRRTYGRAGIRRVRNHFTARQMAQRHLDCYRRCLWCKDN